MTVLRGELEDLYEQIRSDPAFEHLRKGKNPLIPGEGATPRAFIIGEAPGADEVMAGRPFVGKSGKVLRQLMLLAGLNSDRNNGTANCWLTNVVKYRPPRNRTPTPQEIKDARGYLRREWLLVGAPKLVIPVGAVALHAIYGTPKSILGCAGNPSMTRKGVLVWPMLHPAYGLRNPDARKGMEKDWTLLGKRLAAGVYNARY